MKNEHLSTEITRNGVTVEVVVEYDEYGCNPRENDNLGTMVCWHRRYNLGDEQPSQDAEDWLKELAMGSDEHLEGKLRRLDDSYHNPYGYGTRESKEYDREHNAAMSALITASLEKNFIMLPLYLYDHGGITISTGSFSCPWDSGQVGFIYISRTKILKEYGAKILHKKLREKVYSMLEAEVAEYDLYLRGERYVVEALYKGKCLDSCGGFLGDDQVKGYIEDMTKHWIESALEFVEEEKLEEAGEFSDMSF